MKEVRTIFFNEEQHKYTDQFGNRFTSMTQCLEKYVPEFDAWGTAQRCVESPRSYYYSWSVAKVVEKWKKDNKKACDKGNEKHNLLEQVVKESTGYKLIENTVFINDELYTVKHILEDDRYGDLDISYFEKTGIKKKYPTIYQLMKNLTKDGWKIYSEVCVYSAELMITGLIDILLVKGGEFMILDWKTNKHDLIPYGQDDNKWKSGYFKKDSQGKETGIYHFTNEYFKPPLNKYQNSTFVHYMLQLSGYSYLASLFGINPIGIILAHIRDEVWELGQTDNEDLIGTEKVEFHNIPLVMEDVKAMFTDHFNNHYQDKQQKLMI
jgi:hypothetical protein